MWIEDTQEFAKFVSAVNTYGVERDGEGVTYTDNLFTHTTLALMESRFRM